MYEFSWGDTVKVRAHASTLVRPRGVAAIVGIREVETPQQAVHFDAPIGTKVYLIEFGDGEAIEVLAGCLELVEAGTPGG